MPSDYANDLMARVGLDTTEWKKGITDLNAGIKHIETGFQATAALMDDWGNSSEGLKKRIETLNDKLALQKQKLDILKKAYEEEVAANGESSRQAQELAKKMYQAKNEIDRTKASIDKYSQAEDEATKKTKALIAELEKSGKKFTDVGDKISGVGNKMTVGITAPVIAAGTAIYKYSSDLTEAENKTEATFGFMSGAVKEWAQDSLNAFGMAKSTAYNAVSLYGDMATSMGLGKSAAADMSMSLVELSADLSSFKNVSLEQSQNALKGIFTGETESLKNLGIVMTETQLKSYAMSKGFEKNYEDLTQAEKVQLRYQYVLESSANAIGDYSRTSGEAAGQVRKLPEALKELASSFRDNVEPAITPIITTINGAIVAFGKMSDGAKQTTVNIALFAAALGPLVSVTGKTVSIVGKAKIAIANYRSNLLKKTQATVADTAAETAHAESLDETATSASGAASGVKGIGTAAKAATPYILAVALALTGIIAYLNKVKSEITKSVEAEYNAKILASNKAHNAIIESLEKEKEEKQNFYDSETQRINNFYDNEIDKLDDTLKAQKKAIETEQDLLKKAHDKRMRQLEEERDLKLEVINIQEENETSEIQKQIDALDALTAAEEKAEKERENNQKLAELQAAINSANTYAEKLEAEKEYNEFVRELERKKTLEIRQLQKQELQNQIETIRQESENKRNQVNEEYEAAKALADDEYTLQKESLDLRLEALDTFIEDETAKLEAAREGKLSILQKETEDYVSELQKQIDKENELKEAAEKSIEDEKKKEVDDQTSWDTMLNPEKFKQVRGHEYEKGKVGYTFWESVWARMIGANASGTDFWRGGLTRINEEGGEILNLPRGTQIIPHDVSMAAAQAYGRERAITNNTNTTNNSTTNNSYNYGEQQKVTVLQIGDKTVAKVIEPAVSVKMSNDIYGRRRSGGAR